MIKDSNPSLFQFNVAIHGSRCCHAREQRSWHSFPPGGNTRRHKRKIMSVLPNFPRENWAPWAVLTLAEYALALSRCIYQTRKAVGLHGKAEFRFHSGIMFPLWKFNRQQRNRDSGCAFRGQGECFSCTFQKLLFYIWIFSSLNFMLQHQGF